MAKYVLRHTRTIDLVAAAIYGVLVTLLLGMPSLARLHAKPVESQDIKELRTTMLNGVEWTEWGVPGHGNILCPPGQRAFRINPQGAPSQVICGYSAQPSQNVCKQEASSSFQCSASSEVRQFYAGVGLSLPENVSGCCPAESSAICQYSDERLSLRSQLYCQSG